MFFHPKLFTSFKGYNRQLFTQDVFAGLTVGVVALPLAMAFAIASGLKPEAGIFTAVIAGGLISLLGGSKVQIGGPAGNWHDRSHRDQHSKRWQNPRSRNRARPDLIARHPLCRTTG